MVLPAMQLSGKIPDNYVQLWAASLLRGMFFITLKYSKVYDKEILPDFENKNSLYELKNLRGSFEEEKRCAHASV